MKLHCKHCDKQLTKSLYPTNWKLKELIEDYYGDEGSGLHKRILHIPVGAFRRWKSWTGNKFLSVHRDSLFLSIPDWKGTDDMIKRATKAGLAVRVVKYEPKEEK